MILSIPWRAISRILPLLLACTLVLLGSGCDTTYTGAGAPDQAAALGPTTLVPGDIIGIQFSGAPSLNQSQKIRPDGKLILPLIGEVAAAGKTVPAFQQELEDSYKQQLKNTEVVITLEGSETRSIVIDGAVQRPGNVPCDRPLTVLEAIMLAGGPSMDADMKKVQIIRLVNGEQQSYFVDLRKAMKGIPSKPVYVESGDIIFVPEAFF